MSMLGACTDEMTAPTDAANPGIGQEKITFTLQATQGGDHTQPSTRTIYKETDVRDDGSAGMAVTWEETGEQIAVMRFENNVPDVTLATFNAVPGSRNADGTSINFEGNIAPSIGGSREGSYVLFYPVPESGNVTQDGNTVKITYPLTGQTQDCTAGQETAHLKKYDVASGRTTLPGTPVTPVTLSHDNSLIRLDLTLPEDNAIKRVELVADSEIFGEKLLVECSGGNNRFSANGLVKSFGLDLTNDAADKQVKAYLLLKCITATTDKKFRVVATATDGSTKYEGAEITATGTSFFKIEQCITIRQTLTKQTD